MLCGSVELKIQYPRDGFDYFLCSSPTQFPLAGRCYKKSDKRKIPAITMAGIFGCRSFFVNFALFGEKRRFLVHRRGQFLGDVFQLRLLLRFNRRADDKRFREKAHVFHLGHFLLQDGV